MREPTVSIIMGIYNCENSLEKSVYSLLNQTFQDWHLIMCEDGSSDQTLKVAEMLQKKFPHKITLLVNEENFGLNFTLNRCLQVAKGTYIARQDADDWSYPKRLEKQVDFLKKNPNFSFVSGYKEHFDEAGTWGICQEIPQPTHQDLFIGPPYCHAACLFKKEALTAVAGYSVAENLLRVEDYHLWYKLHARGFKGYNLQEVLYACLDDRNAFRRRNLKNRWNEMHVKYLIAQHFELPWYYYPLILRPLLVGLLPRFLYDHLHKGRLTEKVGE